MKLGFCLIAIILLFAILPGCGRAERGENREATNHSGMTEAKGKELLSNVTAVAENRRNEWETLDEIYLRTGEECVPDAETALDFLNVLLRRYQKSGFFCGYTPQLIEYQEEPGIWVITCRKGYDGEKVGAEMCFAIRRDNARVICIWLGEGESEAIQREETGEAPALTDEERAALIQNVCVLGENEQNLWERVDESRKFTEPCIPDAETALQYGNVLLRRFQRAGDYQRFVPQRIKYQEEPFVWIVACWEDVEDQLGASVSFAISAKDGQVLAIIWYFE